MSKSAEDRWKRKQEKEADRKFANDIKFRDGWVCSICKKVMDRKQDLHCHHIIPRENRELRHDLMNGIALCCLHHKFSLEISPHKNAFEFFVWLEKNRPEQFWYLKEKVKNSI